MINPLLYWVFFWVSTAQANVVVGMDTFIVQPQVAQVLAEDLTANIHILREALQDDVQAEVIWRDAPDLPLVKDDLFDDSLQQIPLPLLKPMQGLDVWLTVRFNRLRLTRDTDPCCVQTELEVELLGIQMHDGAVSHIPIQVELLWVLSRDISTHWQALFEVLRVELSGAIRGILNNKGQSVACPPSVSPTMRLFPATSTTKKGYLATIVEPRQIKMPDRVLWKLVKIHFMR